MAKGQDDKRELKYPTGDGIAAGIALGVALGLAMENLLIGIAMGIAIGSGLEASEFKSGKSKKRKDKE